MKYYLNVLNTGKYCFFVTPILMIILFTLLKLGKINSSTEVPIWISTLIDWRYSSESFFLVLFIGAVFCILVSLLINTQPIPSREKNRIGKFYNLLANFISNLILLLHGQYFHLLLNLLTL